MKTIGIIAEYNPFHNGHAYQIKEIRKRTQADYIVAAMSGDFVQRGAPAIIDKYTRTAMALSCGADLVIELPTLWATASAEDFAMAGVTLFDKMGCIDGICFGAETDDLPLLSSLADILADEPIAYKEALSSYMKEGLTFPAARARAIETYLTVSHDIDNCSKAEMVSSIMNEPNNILAIEYLKALKRRNSSIQPYLLKRKGADYHETAIRDSTSADFTEAPTASATAIRRLLLPAQEQTPSLRNAAKITCYSDENTAAALPDTAMPDAAKLLLSDYLQKSPPLCTEDFSQILGYRLLTLAPDTLAKVSGCNIDIANRLCRNRQTFYSYERFVEQNKSKDVTYTRISRILLHLLLHISQEQEAGGKEMDYIPYLRILGFRNTYSLPIEADISSTKNSSALLTALKKSAAVPVISKLSNAEKLLSAQAFSMLENDIFAADLYEQVKFQKQQQNPLTHGNTAAAQSEYRRRIIIL